ncbi:thioesterase superfamily protein [Salinisphaera shabanensis T35B1]|jgi:acyl-CoA hydrolase|uniref:Acetyl-CoA hydrolase protein n=1 Tax=Salinisphaera shabanensis E1L3A TaxID=1033802 RepID=U2EKI8_9GAMM|nr:acyl-CoA thioesterase [Salinisphaera shabanensis]ERJ18777.1 acetyl-CoA hydrolase protein [Salinisphaera shabanensis E1L3A]
MNQNADADITLRFLAEPSDVNFGGNVHGGNVMKWIDHAGYTCAANWSSAYCVTAYVGGIRFLKPISVGDLVELKAELMHTGRTSMHISVSVHARNPRDRERRFTTHCILVFVALDDSGKPLRIRDFEPVTEHSKRLNAYAKRMIELREQLQTESQSFLSTMEA